MRPTARPEPVGEAFEVGFIDGLQHLGGRTLDKLVLQRRHTQGPLPSIRLGDVYPPNRLRPVRSAPQSVREVPEAALQILAVRLPRLSVDARCRVPLQGEVRGPQPFNVVNVVPERGELQPLIPSGCLTYPLQRAGQTIPALCPVPVWLKPIALGQTPSLHRLRRGRSPARLVRRLLRYYGPVRLPRSVHRRRAP